MNKLLGIEATHLGVRKSQCKELTTNMKENEDDIENII